MLTQVDLDGVTARTLKELTQVDLDGTTVRNLKQLWQNDLTGTPRLIWSAMAVILAPDYVGGYVSSGGAASANTSYTTATVTGGTAPFTYVWTVTGDFSALSTTAPTNAFQSIALSPGAEANGDAYVTVTDAAGSVAVSNTITLYATNVF